MIANEDIIETTHGKISGKELFRVQGVEMGWQGSELEARDVARRVRNAFTTSPRPQQGRGSNSGTEGIATSDATPDFRPRG